MLGSVTDGDKCVKKREETGLPARLQRTPLTLSSSLSRLLVDCIF